MQLCNNNALILTYHCISVSYYVSFILVLWKFVNCFSNPKKWKKGKQTLGRMRRRKFSKALLRRPVSFLSTDWRDLGVKLKPCFVDYAKIWELRLESRISGCGCLLSRRWILFPRCALRNVRIDRRGVDGFELMLHKEDVYTSESVQVGATSITTGVISRLNNGAEK